MEKEPRHVFGSIRAHFSSKAITDFSGVIQEDRLRAALLHEDISPKIDGIPEDKAILVRGDVGAVEFHVYPNKKLAILALAGGAAAAGYFLLRKKRSGEWGIWKPSEEKRDRIKALLLGRGRSGRESR